MRTYAITAESAEKAYERFMNEEGTEFPIVYEGEATPAIIVGISQRA